MQSLEASAQKKLDRHPNTSLQPYRHACRRFEKPPSPRYNKGFIPHENNPIRVESDGIHGLEEVCF